MPDDAALLDDDTWAPELGDDGSPPARQRRRLVTPLTAGLSGLLLATAGFIAGVQVQKGTQDGGGAPTAVQRAGFPGARGAGAGAGRQGQGQATVGSVASKRGRTLYVKNADGTTVRVKTSAQSKVTRSAATSSRGIYPGDTVIVQGTKDRNGDVVATQITATSKSAAAGGGGARGGGALFGPPPGGAPGG